MATLGGESGAGAGVETGVELGADVGNTDAPPIDDPTDGWIERFAVSGDILWRSAPAGLLLRGIIPSMAARLGDTGCTGRRGVTNEGRARR